MTAPANRFDADYYNRYYVDPQTRAASPEEQLRLAQFIASYLNYLQLPICRIVDLGCGLGALLRGLSQYFPNAESVGVELSPYLCDTYGWQPGSVIDYHDEPFDLVVCSDVLGYLDKQDCAQAISNLAALCDGALYLSVVTTEDLEICDPQHTDMQQIARPHKCIGSD